MVCSLWHLQTWMYQWFAETLTSNMIFWRQGGFSCGRTEKLLKNDLIGCMHGWHGHSCTGYCESNLMPWKLSPVGAKLSQLFLNLSRFHNFTWEVFLVFYFILFSGIWIQMWWEFCRCLSRQHCQSNPHSPWWGRLAQFLWIMNWKQNGNEVWLTVNNNPVSWWEKSMKISATAYSSSLSYNHRSHKKYGLTHFGMVSCFFFFLVCCSRNFPWTHWKLGHHWNPL